MNELSATPSRVRTNPTAIWLSRNSMLAKAMMAAIRAPTPIAARKPTMTLPETSAATNPVMAESMIVPSMERFTTPAFSEIVSPTTA